MPMLGLKNSFSAEIVMLLICLGHVFAFRSIQCFGFLSKNECIGGGV